MAQSAFECCHFCKPPKRYPGCQDHCPDGIAAKANHKERKEADDKARHRTTFSVYAQKVDSIKRASKGKGKNF